MRSDRVASAAQAAGLGGFRERYRYNGLFWLLMSLVALPAAGWESAAGFGWGTVAVFAVLAGPMIALGVLTRRNRAVHTFAHGIVLTGLLGRVKAVADWSEVHVRVKRAVPQRVGPPLYAYGVGIGGREAFGFAERQIVGGGSELAAALMEGVLAGGLRRLDEGGELVLGPLRITRAELVAQAPGGAAEVRIPVQRIARVRLDLGDPRTAPAQRLVVAVGERAEEVAVPCPPADLGAAGRLIAALAGTRFEIG
ncbi:MULTISPECIES: hypothetical protein [Kitasatospora]|uniref:DUF304 domain-containing protein n=2 Tax=Kitasatospora TaxID=2063 RepID=A0ABT1J1I2_9ACTN|nr:hypothetical protein [Kitasatospora paracochleata]MCP2311289.1 hypothetical protein [Kitasatospora paracochleata]